MHFLALVVVLREFTKIIRKRGYSPAQLSILLLDFVSRIMEYLFLALGSGGCRLHKLSRSYHTVRDFQTVVFEHWKLGTVLHGTREKNRTRQLRHIEVIIILTFVSTSNKTSCSGEANIPNIRLFVCCNQFERIFFAEQIFENMRLCIQSCCVPVLCTIMLRTCTSPCATCAVHCVHRRLHCTRPVDVVNYEKYLWQVVRGQAISVQVTMSISSSASARRMSGYALYFLLPFSAIVDERNKFPTSLLPPI